MLRDFEFLIFLIFLNLKIHNLKFFWGNFKFQNILFPSKWLFPLICTTVYSNTVYIPAQDERVCRSYRFHNHPNKNFSSLVSSTLISLYLPLSLLSLPRETGAFDIWQNKRLSTGLIRSLPLPSKIDSCDPPFCVLSFVFFLRQFFFLLALLLRAPVCTLTNLLSTRGRVEENRRDAFPDSLSCVHIQRAIVYKLPKIGPLFEPLGYLSTSRWPPHSSSQLSFIHETRFLSAQFLSYSNTMLFSGCEIIFCHQIIFVVWY